MSFQDSPSGSPPQDPEVIPHRTSKRRSPTRALSRLGVRARISQQNETRVRISFPKRPEMDRNSLSLRFSLNPLVPVPGQCHYRSSAQQHLQLDESRWHNPPIFGLILLNEQQGHHGIGFPGLHAHWKFRPLHPRLPCPPTNSFVSSARRKKQLLTIGSQLKGLVPFSQVHLEERARLPQAPEKSTCPAA